MDKGDVERDNNIDVYAAKEGFHHGLHVAEANGDPDEDDLAFFGKRQQLKVRSLSPWVVALKVP